MWTAIFATLQSPHLIVFIRMIRVLRVSFISVGVVFLPSSPILIPMIIVPVLSIVLGRSRLRSVRAVMIIVLVVIVIYLRVINIVDTLALRVRMRLRVLGDALGLSVSLLSLSSKLTYLMIIISIVFLSILPLLLFIPFLLLKLLLPPLCLLLLLNC